MKSTPWRSKRQAPGPRKMTLLLVMGLGLSLIAGSCSMGRSEVPNADGLRKRWMSRVLGLEQHVTWTKPLRAQDRFAFEARDRPWQPDWGIPKTRPWIEGLWVVRRGGMLEGDELIYRVEDFF